MDVENIAVNGASSEGAFSTLIKNCLRLVVVSVLGSGALCVLGASIAEAQTATVSWIDNSGKNPTINDEETGFQVERNLNGGAFALLGTTAPDAQTFVDNTLFADNVVDNKFCYRVRAINTAGASAYATTATPGTTDCKIVPRRPIIVPSDPNGLLVQ